MTTRWTMQAGWALLATLGMLALGCPEPTDDDDSGDDDAADDDTGDDDGGDDDGGDDDVADDDDASDDDGGDDDGGDDDGGDDDTAVDTVDAHRVTGEVTWALDFDAAAEGAGYTDCQYTRTYAGLQFLDQPYLCPACSIQVGGDAEMTAGFSTCYEPIFGGTAIRPEWWGLAWSGTDGDGGEFYRGATENLYLNPLTTVDAITLGQPFDLEWDSEYALSDLGLTDPGNMALSATGTATVTLDPATQILDPWPPRKTPYSCGWPLGNPGNLATDFVLEIDEVFPVAWLEDECGELVDLWDFWGSYLVVDSSQPDCGPCQQMAQTAPQFVADMAAQGVTVVFLSLLGEGLSNVVGEPSQSAFDSWVATYGASGEPILKDRGFGYAIFEPYHGDDLGYPTWAVVRPDMTVLEAGVGFSSWDDIEALILADAP